MKRRILWLSILVTACAARGLSTASPAPLRGPTEPAPSVTIASTATGTPIYTPTLTPTPSASPTAAPTLQLCSPLKGFTLVQIPDAVVNPFHPPPPGSDDPHEGVDLAERQGDMAVAGMPIQAVLPGIVAATMIDRFPYGNAILIETPLKNLPEDWLNHLDLPALNPNQSRDPALTCPGVTVYPDWKVEIRSLYLMYAHMHDPSPYQAGDVIACGSPLGSIGDSGNALNPHLHLETRVGPAGARFSSMAHYDSSASLEEMDNYCTWRVSGWFMLLDPMRLLALQP